MRARWPWCAPWCAPADIDEPLRFTAAYTDGETLVAYRWACDDKPPSLYWRESPGGLLVVSEPIDADRDGWREIPRGCTLLARPGAPPPSSPA